MTSWGAWDVVYSLAPRAYSLGVSAAGGLALLLPPDDAVAEEPGELLDLLDGLTWPVRRRRPGRYGAKPHPETRVVAGARPLRAGAGHARSSATCRCWASAAGCRCSTWPAAARWCSTCPTWRRTATHPGLQRPRGAPRRRHTRRPRGRQRHRGVKSHHQGIDELGEGLVAVGWAGDTVEAIELPGKPYALGVLWHAEEDEASG